MNREILDRVMELADTAWHEENLSCREAEWDGAFSTLRLYLESGAIPQCVLGNKRLVDTPEGDAIDALMPTGYTLEISSPGLETPLRRIHHFEKVINQKVSLSVHTESGLSKYEGVLVSVADAAITLTTSTDTVTLPLSKVEKARLIVDWDAIQPSEAGENEE